MIKSICVYCGSSLGNDPIFEKLGIELGNALASRKIRLVYGGAKTGVMGAVAKGCLDNNGEVLGVIPEFLDEIEISNEHATELIITKSMHERKTIMAQNSDAFIALPGGMGTLEEISEILTWAQLGLVNAPIGFLNVEGYYDCLFEMFKNMNSKGLLRKEHLELFVDDQKVEGLLEQMLNIDKSRSHQLPIVELT
ncbi:LOG family protein [Reichenbachiella versicolor]|uniref:LOG family protein n=1 Tax=Reichenbachiella versicolor TaxID=1821036 RepID=UPI000D6E863A|nr:TIGR00730 family Rossman fold protein [Reichenbachiella versicolor]